MRFQAKIYIKLNGRYYRVLAIAFNDAEANADMANDPFLSVIHTEGQTAIMVHAHDKGSKEI